MSYYNTVALTQNWTNFFYLQLFRFMMAVALAVTTIAGEAASDQAMAQGAPARPALSLVQRPLFNTREGYGSTVFPGLMSTPPP